MEFLNERLHEVLLTISSVFQVLVKAGEGTNPSTSAQLLIINGKGNQVISKSVKHMEAVDIGSLKNGIYYYTLSDGRNIQAGKFLKK